MADAAAEMVIFARTYDLLRWLLPQAEKFPKAHCFLVTARLIGAALDFQEALFHANARPNKGRQAYLETADAHLNTLRLYLRLAHDWGWLTTGGGSRQANIATPAHWWQKWDGCWVGG